jgi:hypothetical protein
MNTNIATPQVSETRPNSLAKDLHCRALLALIYGCDRHPNDFQEHIDFARRILSHPTPFDGGIHTPDVHGFITDWQKRTWSLDEESEHYRKTAVAVHEIQQGSPRVPMASTAEDVQTVMNLSIFQATVMGAALMYELMNGGAR